MKDKESDLGERRKSGWWRKRQAKKAAESFKYARQEALRLSRLEF